MKIDLSEVFGKLRESDKHIRTMTVDLLNAMVKADMTKYMLRFTDGTSITINIERKETE